MKTIPWPTTIPRHFTPRVGLMESPLARCPMVERYDKLCEHVAHKRRFLDPQMTGLTNTYNEQFFINKADFTAYSTSTSEASLISGLNVQPVIPANYFLFQGASLRGIRIEAQGVLSTTSTPTIIFQVRTGTTSGATFLSGASVGVSAAITTASGVTNKWWRLQLDLICTVTGIGTGNATLAGAGYVASPGGFASPFVYALEPTTPDTATWTSVFDASVSQYLNLSATWSASSSSNTITCKQLIVSALG